MERHLSPVAYVVLGSIALYIAFNVIKRKRQQKDGGQEKQSSGKEATASSR